MNDKQIITINGKPFIQYVGLLEESHKRGIQSLEVEIVQFPNADNDFTCICKAPYNLRTTKYPLITEMQVLRV